MLASLASHLLHALLKFVKTERNNRLIDHAHDASTSSVVTATTCSVSLFVALACVRFAVLATTMCHFVFAFSTHGEVRVGGFG